MDKVVHFEIPVDDWDRAIKFYKNNFGWDIMDMKGPNGEMIYGVSSPLWDYIYGTMKEKKLSTK